jgi:ligand-binding sensor domain-containing protein
VFRAIHRDTDGNIETEELANLQNQQFTSFGEDASGELYVSAVNGIIYRVQDIVSTVRDNNIIHGALQPNPALESFVIVDDSDSPLDFSINDMKGQVIRTGTTSRGQQISCDRIDSGVYVVKWQIGDKITSGKLLIVK